MGEPLPIQSITPETPLQFLKGVGPSRARLLAAAGLHTAGDLLHFFPFRYEDRRKPATIALLASTDGPVTLRGRVISASQKTSPIRRLQIFEVILDDGTGTVMLVWFNQPFLQEKIQRGEGLVIYGQARINRYGKLQIENPDFEKADPSGEAAEGEGSIVPVYSSVSGIQGKVLRRLVQQALQAVSSLDDPLPAELRKKLALEELGVSIVNLHYPAELDEAFLANRSPAHRRLIFQEFLLFQLGLRLRRAGLESADKGRRIVMDDAIRSEVRALLPFPLTGAQKRVLKEIASDLASRRPMYRLLQGDVGSGKTIISLITAMIVIHHRHQAALLAPTEILVDQHYQRLRQLCSASGMVIAKLTGATPEKERKNILQQLASGAIHLIIGTHALLEPRVRFHSLGLAIVDEQHRFGVEQRQKLFAKGSHPDILVMTATPIPRSLALAMFGDLELSVIDELPPGRRGVKSVVRGTGQLDRVHEFLDQQAAEGAQSYVVFPVIDEAENGDIKPLSEGFAKLQLRLPHRKIGMLHGRLSSAEKEATMMAFARGELEILASTTVIEVGVDVPNASVILIMDSDRFGLSQLHQLRGRVGRGERKSFCILLRDERASEEAKNRLKLFEKTSDGFEVSERDLQLRGAGDFLGTRQSGLPDFRFGDLLRDHELMERARSSAIELMSSLGHEAVEQMVRGARPVAEAGSEDRD